MRGLFDPIIEFYRPLPPLAYLPLVIIWFGIGEFPKTFLIFLAIFAPMAIAARSGVKSVSIEQIHAAYAMGERSEEHTSELQSLMRTSYAVFCLKKKKKKPKVRSQSH